MDCAFDKDAFDNAAFDVCLAPAPVTRMGTGGGMIYPIPDYKKIKRKREDEEIIILG